MMAHMPHRRQNSVSDNSYSNGTPSSAVSEGSETFEATSTHEWQFDSHNSPSLLLDNLDLQLDSLSLENSISEITDHERAQIESFFSGLGTEVFVSSSLANLYKAVGHVEWQLIYTGIPVLLFDKGSARSRSSQKVTFVLAERGTCFALWKDTISDLSSYKVAGPAFHTMSLSNDPKKVVGFSFDSNHAANLIRNYIQGLLSSSRNVPQSSMNRKRKTKRSKSTALPSKSQISHPCQFLHVTQVTAHDTPRYFSLQAFLPSNMKQRVEAFMSPTFRQRNNY